MAAQGDASWLQNAHLLRASGEFRAAAGACLDILSEVWEDEDARTFAEQLAGDNAHPALALWFAKGVVQCLPEASWAHFVLASGYATSHLYSNTIACCDQAIALNPDFAEAHSLRGTALLKQRRHAEALACSTRAVALNPDFAEGWAGLGRVFGKLKQYRLAIGAYRRALAIEPDYPFLKGRLLQQMILSCDWQDIDPLIDEIERDVVARKQSARPFAWQAVSTSPRSLQICAGLFNQANDLEIAKRVPRPRTNAAGKIRVGYVSGEFREHSTSYLRVGVFEHHDKDLFEIVAFDNGWDDGGQARARIDQAIDRIVDIRGLSDDRAAMLIEQEEIDILVDLNGFNGLNRTSVFALRPAPVQATFPGYPGTLGATYIDYIIADETVIPPHHRQFYAEKPVYMPDTYQANDQNRAISPRSFTRQELGLPEHGTVFCCFNNNYKIMPTMLESWIRIMNAVPGSVLWLLADNAASVANLRKEASRRGLDSDRLIFAERMNVADHLARHRAADLFLDTSPCNAHATASDALWSGLPVLTRLGETFSGRVAASLLRAIDLPELIAETVEDYERKAVALVSNAVELSRLKQRLADHRLTTPLFDTLRYTRHLERAYSEMHRRHLSDERPDRIVVR
jgi:predicted O-linked N-acetylglucosamine transferase (SPINDLY family)